MGLNQQNFIYSWLGFFLIMLMVISGFVIWAWRSKQFSQQEHAKHLPLESDIPTNDEEKNG